jgi:N-acetylmuramoyl-L-alanine amidase
MQISKIQQGIGIITSLFLLLLAINNLKADDSVGKISVSNSKNSSVIQAQMNQKPDYNIIKLSNPERLVIDFKNISFRTTETFSKSDDLISSFRIGNIGRKIKRAVFEMNNSFMIVNDKVLKLSNGEYVLEINLNKTGIEDFRKKRASSENRKESASTLNIPQFQPLAKEKLEFENSIFAKNTKSEKIEQKAPVVNTSNTDSNKKSQVSQKVGNKPAEINKNAPKRKIRIVLDPGHGGQDPGAISLRGTREKDVVLRYALILKQKLENTGRYVVFMTRSKDTFLTLEERVRKAKVAKGDLFISMHADAHPNPETRGLSVYTISEGRAQWELDKLTQRARRQEVVSGIDLRSKKEDVQYFLLDLVQTNTQNTSKSFAEFLVNELGDEARLLFNPHREAGFVVLTGVNVPAVLLELGYMTNRYEEQLLRTTAYRNKLTNSIMYAIEGYFKENPI